MPITAQDVMAAQVEAALLLAGEEQGDDDAALSPATLKKIRAVLALDPGTLANDINTEDATDGEDEDDLEEAEEGRYSHIDFSPPEGVRKAAKRGLELRREHGRGGTEVGVARARDLSNGKDISPETARRMHSFFARHGVNHGKEGWGDSSDPSPAYVAWLLWGGDPGKSWAAKLVKQMDAADKDDIDESMGVVSTGDISQTASVQGGKRKPIEESAPGRPLIDILTDEDEEPARLIESWAGMLDDEPLMEAGDMPKNHTGFWPDSAGRNYYYQNGKRTKAPKDKEPAKKGKGKASDGEDDESVPAKQPKEKPPTARQAHAAAKKDHAAALKTQNAAAKEAMKAGKDHSKALTALSKAKSQHDTSKAKLEAAEARLQKARTTKQKAAAQAAVDKADAAHSATAEKLAAARDAEHAAREAHGAAVAAHAEHGERVKAAADALAGAAGAVAEKRPRVAKLSAEQVGKAAEAALASPADVTDEQVAALKDQLPQLGKPALATLASKAGVKGASKLRKDSLVLAITRAVEAGRGQASKAAAEEPKAAGPVSHEEVSKTAEQVVADLLPQHADKGGMVPIHQIRDAIRERLGDEAASHEVLDDVLQALAKTRRYRLVSLSDPRGTTPDQQADGVPGMGETFFYIKPAGQPATSKAATADTVKAAFRKLDPDGDNLVRMDHLQDALGIKDRAEFHAAVNDLRKAGVLTLSNYEGGEGDGIEDSLRTSSIEDRGTGRLLAYASLRQ